MKPKGALYPLLFDPVFKDYVWGGRRLETMFNRILPPGPIAESWEIAAHPKGTTPVRNGPLAGTPLTSLLDDLGLDLIGSNNTWALNRRRFPLLVKLLDAHSSLSVQVHPDNDYAKIHEGGELGKSEAWLILAAGEDSRVILGVQPGTTVDAFRQAIDSRDLMPYLHQVPVKAGDVIDVPAGSLHAILGGVVIAEIQQNSDTTYRVFDWNRDDPDRPLHIKQSLDVINFQQIAPQVVQRQLISEQDGVSIYHLCRNPYFTLEEVRLAASSRLSGCCDGTTLEIWGCLEGMVSVQAAQSMLPLPAVQFCLLPANLGSFTLDSPAGGRLIRAYSPSMPAKYVD